MVEMEKKQYQKMMFLMNALDNGWKIQKSQDNYIFTKKHENRREIFQENYLETFLISNSTITGKSGEVFIDRVG
jgi:hypothetical protein